MAEDGRNGMKDGEYMVHDPAIYEDAESGRFYIYSTGAFSMVSEDLIHWESLGKVVESVPQEAQDWTGSKDIWAPDLVKQGEEYRLYCSNSSWGVQQSCIFMATAKKPEGPFVPGPVVIKTGDHLNVNGIDANIIRDHESGRQYLLYGSFWDGIRILPLDNESGLVKEPYEGIPGEGVCLARRAPWTSGSIEGPYMIYCKENGYYYLFVSYGSLKSDYNIRIGRSRCVTGPFLDYFGHDMADPQDDELDRGLMIAAGYRWLSGEAYMGPGHNSVLQRSNGEMYLVCHIRRLRFCEDDCGPGLLQIRRLFLTEDDWITASAQPYADSSRESVSAEELIGVYERIELRPSIPQGIAHAHPLILFADGRLEMASVQGEWKMTAQDRAEFCYGPHRESVQIERGYDKENGKETILLSGLTQGGICSWAKKVKQAGG